LAVSTHSFLVGKNFLPPLRGIFRLLEWDVLGILRHLFLNEGFSPKPPILTFPPGGFPSKGSVSRLDAARRLKLKWSSISAHTGLPSHEFPPFCPSFCIQASTLDPHGLSFTVKTVSLPFPPFDPSQRFFFPAFLSACRPTRYPFAFLIFRLVTHRSFPPPHVFFFFFH